jgi:predicted metal-binding membrane protein
LNRIRKSLVTSLILVSAITWIVSIQQYDTMMSSMMMFYNPVALSLFTGVWTVGMAAMMFPAILPMVLLYDRLIRSNKGSVSSSDTKQIEKERKTSVIVNKKEHGKAKKLLFSISFFLSFSSYSLKMVLFVASYLVVWAITGIAILIGWSITMNYFFMESSISTKQLLDMAFGVLLIISGLYQFSRLKTKCLGYCESPISFFMRRWRSGTVGAVKMGTYHGLYCLGCCWPYFLLMVALGWMNLLWMALFAAIIFGEKVWIKGGRWIARGAGIGFLILGILGILDLTEIPTGSMDVVIIGNDVVIRDKDMNMNMDIDGNTMGTNSKY